MDPIVGRIVGESGVPNLVEVLAERLSPTDLQSLLLAVYQRRAQRERPNRLLQRYAQNRFVRPSPVPPEAHVAFDRLAFSLAAPGFEAIELSPVCPLGTNAVVAPVDPNLSVATVRNTEVVSDSTNVLALECAVRRQALRGNRQQAGSRVALCASHRLLRAQLFQGPVSFAHFRLFALCTAGRQERALGFELDSVLSHLDFYLRLLAAWREAGASLVRWSVALTPLEGGPSADQLQAGVIDALAERYPGVRVDVDPDRESGRGYYERLCFHVHGYDAAGQRYLLADGGCTAWTQRLLSDARERLTISGIGAERLLSAFPIHQDAAHDRGG